MTPTDIWTNLLGAMRADGMIAHCITGTGPATTAFINGLYDQMESLRRAAEQANEHH